MDTLASSLPLLLLVAWLLPLGSFALILLAGPGMGPRGRFAGHLATAAIIGSCVCSFVALAQWTGTHGVWVAEHHEDAASGEGEHHDDGEASAARHHGDGKHHEADAAPTYYSGDWYTLGAFGKLRITIGYYIDALTVVMFCMVTLIATCIHFYAQGYMHEELGDVTDHEVTLSSGDHLHRPGRYHRFFQYLSLFCFSMLGVVVAGNMAMVFVFWELVGICSYFLIGFYIERDSASNAANKAFIVNRVGDFGMLIGLMALWASLGTFALGDTKDADGQVVAQGIFSQVRDADHHDALRTPEGMVAAAEASGAEDPTAYGYALLVVAGIGIFCGCVGKSAQFPLHVWLPDAMEGPTPVSALVHSATMVAAGVYLVGRFFPVFAPEVLLVIALVGCITLFLAATIAITATDIKRVLAYSTVSQLGYMMFALGVGGWIAGMLHLITHAFFKSLLFLCSGSVIHAVHTNDMTEMGGLRKKMPYTAYTMLVGCLAIIGAGVPISIWFAGFSGYYSKDSIIAQALAYKSVNPLWGVMFFVAAGGAAMTAFYMFRLWFLTFTGQPRNKHRYDHAHESPKVMYLPLVVLSVFAVAVVWPNFEYSPLVNLLKQATPAGISAAGSGLPAAGVVVPDEHTAHAFHGEATLYAFLTAMGGLGLAVAFYGMRWLSPSEVRSQFSQVYRLLWNRWWFDEIYDVLLVRPVHLIAKFTAMFDRRIIDGIVDGCARVTLWVSKIDDAIDRYGVDWLIDVIGNSTHSLGLTLRAAQTGRLRQYVLFVVIATVALFVVISFAVAGR